MEESGQDQGHAVRRGTLLFIMRAFSELAVNSEISESPGPKGVAAAADKQGPVFKEESSLFALQYYLYVSLLEPLINA